MLLLVQVALLVLAGLSSLLWYVGFSGPVDLVQILLVLIIANLVGVADGVNKRCV